MELTKRFEVRCTDKELKDWSGQAGRLGLAVSVWVRLILNGVKVGGGENLGMVVALGKGEPGEVSDKAILKKAGKPVARVAEKAEVVGVVPEKASGVGEWKKHPTMLRQFRNQYGREPKAEEFELYEKRGI